MQGAGERLGWGRLLFTCLLIAAGAMSAVGLAHTFVLMVSEEGRLIDFWLQYGHGEDFLRGVNPYPEYVYPPLTLFAVTLLALMPFGLAQTLLMVGLVCGVAATLWIVGVRDWRCYVAAFLWAPVLSAIQTGNVTIWLGLGAALAWRYRERSTLAGLGVAVTLATKFLLWPLVVWFEVTRRRRAAAASLALAVALFVGSWAVIGFAGLRGYLDALRDFQGSNEGDSYTAYVLALDLGVSTSVARALSVVVALSVLAACVVAGRRGNDRGAFALAIAAALAFTPIAWLHYFELLLVAVAVAQPRLGPAWFVPLAMWLAPGSGNGTTFQTVVVLSAAALTIALALWSRPAPAYEVGRRTITVSSSPR